jgi:hypothetical protein
MGTRFRLRHVRNVAAVIAATAVLAAVGLHTPMVRARALTFLLARLAESGLIARADRLDYNLLTRTVRLSGLTLAVPSAADTRFSPPARSRSRCLVGDQRSLQPGFASPSHRRASRFDVTPTAATTGRLGRTTRPRPVR